MSVDLFRPRKHNRRHFAFSAACFVDLPHFFSLGFDKCSSLTQTHSGARTHARTRDTLFLCFSMFNIKFSIAESSLPSGDSYGCSHRSRWCKKGMLSPDSQRSLDSEDLFLGVMRLSLSDKYPVLLTFLIAVQAYMFSRTHGSCFVSYLDTGEMHVSVKLFFIFFILLLLLLWLWFAFFLFVKHLLMSCVSDFFFTVGDKLLVRRLGAVTGLNMRGRPLCGKCLADNSDDFMANCTTVSCIVVVSFSVIISSYTYC